jgi:hypothetical protein
MRKDLIRRLEKLEASQEEFQIVGVVWQTETPDSRRALAPNERRVEDWYVTPDDVICELKERITTDPSDSGRNYLRDAMGHESEDPSLEREITGGGDIIAVVRNPNLRPPSSPESGRVAGTSGSQEGSSRRV